MFTPEFTHIIPWHEAHMYRVYCNHAIPVRLNIYTLAQLNKEELANISIDDNPEQDAVILCAAEIQPLINSIGWEVRQGIPIGRWRVTYRPRLCECEFSPRPDQKICFVDDAVNIVRQLKWSDRIFLSLKQDITTSFNFDPLAGPVALLKVYQK